MDFFLFFGIKLPLFWEVDYEMTRLQDNELLSPFIRGTVGGFRRGSRKIVDFSPEHGGAEDE